MKQIKFNQPFIKIFTLIIVSFVTFSFTTKFGLDSYTISLNNRVVLQQAVNQPLHLRVLQLSKENENDELRINYIHCMNKGGGTDRSIALKDDKGNLVKKWTFNNATGSDLNMTIAIKELLKLKKNQASLKFNLYYAARELPKGELLAALNFK